MTRWKAGDVAEGGAGEVGAPAFEEEVADEVAVEFGRDLGTQADDIEGVAEDELAGFVGVEEGARADEVAETEEAAGGGVPEGEGVVADEVGEGLLAPFLVGVENEFFVSGVGWE